LQCAVINHSVVFTLCSIKQQIMGTNQHTYDHIQALKQTLEAFWKEYVFLGCLLAIYIGFIYYYNPHITSLTY
jgi:hypothetical protein